MYELLAIAKMQQATIISLTSRLEALEGKEPKLPPGQAKKKA